jgi:RNA methyltransferase, TrmH family
MLLNYTMISKSTIKYIQSLKDKKNRDQHNVFIAEGPKVVNEFIEQNIFTCSALYCTKKWNDAYVNSLQIDSNKINIIEDFELDKISALSIANQVLAVFDKKVNADTIDFEGKLTLVLEDVQDPGNLGTIIRTADWFGIKNIICTKATADCYNPKVVQSTMASLGRVNIIYTDIITLIATNPSIKTYAAVLAGKDVKLQGKITEGFILMGNESKGLSENLISNASEKITITKIGETESLNVAVAAAIILHSVC